MKKTSTKKLSKYIESTVSKQVFLSVLLSFSIGFDQSLNKNRIETFANDKSEH